RSLHGTQSAGRIAQVQQRKKLLEAMIVQKLYAGRRGVVVARLRKDLRILARVMAIDARPFGNERSRMTGQQTQPHVIVLGVAKFLIEAAHRLPGRPMNADADAADVVAIEEPQYLEFALRQGPPEGVIDGGAGRLVEEAEIGEVKACARLAANPV